MRKNSKIDETTLVGLAKVGITQITISNIFNCHQTAVSARMHKLGLNSFGSKELENIFFNLTPDEKEWYVTQVQESSFSEFIIKLIKDSYGRMQ